MDYLEAKIIVVGEDEAERRALREALEEDGYTVFEAASTAAALDEMKHQFFDVMLVDYKLADLNGIELIKQSSAVSKDTVPIIITAYSSLEIAVESMRIGAHDYMVKPVNIDELKKNIENILVERDDLARGKAAVEGIVKRLHASDESFMIAASEKGTTGAGVVFRKDVVRPLSAIIKTVRKYFWDAN